MKANAARKSVASSPAMTIQPRFSSRFFLEFADVVTTGTLVVAAAAVVVGAVVVVVGAGVVVVGHACF